jgi:hypothetical protein
MPPADKLLGLPGEILSQILEKVIQMIGLHGITAQKMIAKGIIQYDLRHSYCIPLKSLFIYKKTDKNPKQGTYLPVIGHTKRDNSVF